MTDPPKGRRAGDPIPADLVREFRKRSGLTQEQLAERLGIRGGKPVVSGWETGRTACEGPAAEFLLHLLGRGNASLDIATLSEELERTWTRAASPEVTWRQVVAVPDAPLTIDAQTFVTLFPRASLPGYQHGFPFNGTSLPGNVCGLTQSGWLGAIPSEIEAAPSYAWLFKRDGRFAYRERLWESERRELVANGVIHVGTEILQALALTHFVRRVGTMLGVKEDRKFVLQIDLEGTRGKALADIQVPLGPGEPFTRWSENHAAASIEATLGEISREPIEVGLRLVSELAAQISAELVDVRTLKRVLANYRRVNHDFQFLSQSTDP